MSGRMLLGGLLVSSLLVFVVACAGPKAVENPTLSPPGGTSAEALASVKEGNRLFAAGRWGAAKTQYELALQAQPGLAEAHYNLALVLDQMGDKAQARAHYIEAANLAPGHKVIWNSRVLRRYGDVPDPLPNGSSAPVLPSLGGLGGSPRGGGAY